MSEWKAKRFYKAVEIEAVDDTFSVTLDGRAVKTPAKAALNVPTRKLAKAISAEWEAQEDEIQPATMPFTRSANAAIDKVAAQISEVIAIVADYGDSDLLCYRAEGPDALVSRQREIWDPYLGWAADTFDARLQPLAGLMHVAQDASALKNLADPVAKMSAFELTAFHDLVALTGSLVLGYAAALDFTTADAIWDASRLDENWQAEQWGADEEAIDAAEAKRHDFLHAVAFFKAAQTG